MQLTLYSAARRYNASLNCRFGGSIVTCQFPVRSSKAGTAWRVGVRPAPPRLLLHAWRFNPPLQRVPGRLMDTLYEVTERVIST